VGWAYGGPGCALGVQRRSTYNVNRTTHIKFTCIVVCLRETNGDPAVDELALSPGQVNDIRKTVKCLFCTNEPLDSQWT